MGGDPAGAQEPGAELRGAQSKRRSLAPGGEAKREGMGGQVAQCKGPAVSNAFPGLDFKAEVFPDDLPAGTCHSCTAWGPAGEEIEANGLAF